MRHLTSGMWVQKGLLLEKLWNSAPRRDHRPGEKDDVLQRRERISAEAAIKGKRWYARMLLERHNFLTSREASQHLIYSSRRLIADTRQRIRVVRNNLAFSRTPRRWIN